MELEDQSKTNRNRIRDLFLQLPSEEAEGRGVGPDTNILTQWGGGGHQSSGQRSRVRWILQTSFRLHDGKPFASKPCDQSA